MGWIEMVVVGGCGLEKLLAAGRRRRITVAGACADEVFEALVLGALLVDHVGAQAELFVRH